MASYFEVVDTDSDTGFYEDNGVYSARWAFLDRAKAEELCEKANLPGKNRFRVIENEFCDDSGLTVIEEFSIIYDQETDSCGPVGSNRYIGDVPENTHHETRFDSGKIVLRSYISREHLMSLLEEERKNNPWFGEGSHG